MFSTFCSQGVGLLALFATGFAIKLLDDYLDEDEASDEPNLVIVLGRGVLAYALFAYAVAAWLRPSWAFTLFLASYACGMLGGGDWLLPSALPAWAETVLALALGLFLAGWREMGSSAAFIFGVQLWDDVWDEERDRRLGLRGNLARRFGRVEALLIGTAMLLIALLLAPLKTLLGLCALPMVLYLAANPWRKETGP